MKLLLAAAFLSLASPLCAQTDATTAAAPPAGSPPPAPAPNSAAVVDQITSVLTPTERDQLMNVRLKAMADNPELQTEEMSLMQKGMSLPNLSPSDQAAFRDQVRAHADKVRAAMIKIDPTVEPLIEKIEAQAQKISGQPHP